jgi:SagB-type dehydrogenase family enzyme
MPIELVDVISARAAADRDAAPPSPGEVFLENSKLQPHRASSVLARLRMLTEDPQLRRVYLQNSKCYPSSPRVGLPPPISEVEASPLDTLVRRAGAAACDTFQSGTLDLHEVSRLLFHGYGVVDRTWGDDGARIRACPSPGAAYPLELYVIALHVADLQPGIYHFEAWEHRLELLKPLTHESAAAALRTAIAADDPDHEAVAVAVVTTAVTLRASHLYGERSYRLILTEAGRVAQGMHLAGTSMDLVVREELWFLDDRVHSLLGVDGTDEIVVGVTLIGRARPLSSPDNLRPIS